MDRYLSCWRITGKCYYVALDESEEEAIKKLSKHVESAHQIELSDEMREKAKALMRSAA